jgi:hypothetical protein
MTLKVLVSGCAAVFGLAHAVQAQDRIDLSKLDLSQYRIQMVKVEEGPKLDGVLDDEVWQRSPVMTGFVQASPDYLSPATERTEVRVLYDEASLYISGMCYDSEPDKVVARETRRDANIFETDDTFAFTLSPVPDNSVVILFNTSPLGAQRDVYAGNFGETFNDSWDGIWRVRARRNDQGWAVEIAIPFKTLRFPKADVQDWTIIFRRQIRRKRETAYWPPLDRAYGMGTMYKMQQAAILAGLEHVEPGRALEILPYSTVGTIGARRLPATTPPNPNQSTIDFRMERDIGGDVKWGVTPNITVDATVNPDFANIESDQEVVNLSRFEFRFEEKRPFFLEGVDLFGFGQSTGFGLFQSASLPLFFSRRIGAQNFDGSITPIDFAAKLTGKTGRTNFAYLNAQTGGVAPSAGGPVPRTNWQVMRIRQDLGQENSLGVMGLFKEPGERMFGFAGKDYNRVLGVDGFLRFGKTQHRLEALVARSWLPDTDPRMTTLPDSTQNALTWAGSLKHTWRSQYLNLTSSYSDVRAGFFADMGFIRRRDIRQASWDAFLSNLFVRKYGIREIQGFYSVGYTDDHQGSFFSNPESWNVELNPGVELENGTQLGVWWTRDFDTLNRTQPIAGVHFPSGEYTFDQVGAGFGTDQGKPVVVAAEYKQGKFYDGRLHNAGLELTLKPIARLLLNLDLTLNRLDRGNPTDIDSVQFKKDDTFISRFRFNYSFTPELYISSFVQLNHSKKTARDLKTGTTTTLVSNLLLAYQLQSGHSFFIAYNQVADDDYATMGINPTRTGTPFRNAGSAIVAKFQYLFNI